MFRIRKIWWTVTVLLISLYIPGKGHALIMHTEQFSRTTLSGGMTFRYGKSRTTTNDNSSESSNLSQNYQLMLSGNLLNSLLIIYRTGIGYSKQESRHNNTLSFKKDRIKYYLETTLLPESNVPLLLHGTRTVEGDSNSNLYGLRWRGKFKTLPATGADITKTTSKGPNTDRQTIDYGLNLAKNLGSSRNLFDYTLFKTEDHTESTESSTMAMNFSNQTKISRSTSINLNAAKGVSKSTPGEENRAEGLNASLRSSPSERFTQAHSYYYNKNEGMNFQSTGESYDGSMTYGFSDSLTSSMNLAVSSSETDSLTFKTETDTLSTYGSLSYQASKKLTLSESISYTKAEFLGSKAGQSNLTDLSALGVKTSARYRTDLSWAKMSTAYSLAYHEESQTGRVLTSQEDTGTSIYQHLSLGLGGMDAMGYATVNASGGYGESKVLTGDSNRRDYNLNISANNKVWVEYVDLFGSYNKNIHKSWISANDSERDRLLINGRSLYFTKYLNPRGNGRTILTFAGSQTTASDNVNKKRTTTMKQINMNHNRALYRGTLNGSAEYSNNQNRSGGSSNSSTTFNLRAAYGRRLLRRIRWKAAAVGTIYKTDGSKRRTLSITNEFKYRMRVWSLGAEHRFSIRKQSRSRSIENRIMLTASRSFLRVF